MHSKVSIFVTNLSNLALFRPLSNLERREGFSEVYFATIDNILAHGKSLLEDADIPQDERKAVKSLLDGALFLSQFVKSYQKSQLENNVNLFDKELERTNPPFFDELKALEKHELGDIATILLAAIHNMRGMVLKNQGKKEDAKDHFTQALIFSSQQSLNQSIIRINLASLYDEAAEKATLQSAVDQIAHHETAMAAVYVTQATKLRKENDRTPAGIKKINDLFNKSKVLFPESNIVRNNWALYLCDEDEMNPFTRQVDELIQAVALFREVIGSDPQRSLIVAPTYLAVTYYKLTAHYAKTDANKAAQCYDNCVDMLHKCQQMITNDEMAELGQKPFQYDAAYRESKRQHFKRITEALMTLDAKPKPILNRYHTTMPKPAGVILMAALPATKDKEKLAL